MAALSLDNKTEFLFREYGFDYQKISADYIRALINGAVARAEIFKEDPPENYLRLLCGYLLSVGTDSDADVLRSPLKITDDEVIAGWAEAYPDPAERKRCIREFEKMFRPALSKMRLILNAHEKRRISSDILVLLFAALACMCCLFPGLGILKTESIVSGYGIFFLAGILFGGIAFIRGSTLYPGSFIKERRMFRNIGLGLFGVAFFLTAGVVVKFLIPENRYKDSFATLLLVIPIVAINLFASYVTGFKQIIRCKEKIKATVSKRMQYMSGTGSRSMYGNSYVYVIRYDYDREVYQHDLSNLRNPVFTSKKHKDGDEVSVYIDPVDPNLYTLLRIPNPIAVTALLMAIGAVVLGILAFVFPDMA